METIKLLPSVFRALTSSPELHSFFLGDGDNPTNEWKMKMDASLNGNAALRALLHVVFVYDTPEIPPGQAAPVGPLVRTYKLFDFLVSTIKEVAQRAFSENLTALADAEKIAAQAVPGTLETKGDPFAFERKIHGFVIDKCNRYKARTSTAKSEMEMDALLYPNSAALIKLVIMFFSTYVPEGTCDDAKTKFYRSFKLTTPTRTSRVAELVDNILTFLDQVGKEALLNDIDRYLTTSMKTTNMYESLKGYLQFLIADRKAPIVTQLLLPNMDLLLQEFSHPVVYSVYSGIKSVKSRLSNGLGSVSRKLRSWMPWGGTRRRRRFKARARARSYKTWRGPVHCVAKRNLAHRASL